MVVYCLKCKTKLRLPDEAIGRKVRCRHCGAKFVTDEAFLKEEARFRHAERKKARKIRLGVGSIGTLLSRSGGSIRRTREGGSFEGERPLFQNVNTYGIIISVLEQQGFVS